MFERGVQSYVDEFALKVDPTKWRDTTPPPHLCVVTFVLREDGVVLFKATRARRTCARLLGWTLTCAMESVVAKCTLPYRAIHFVLATIGHGKRGKAPKLCRDTSDTGTFFDTSHTPLSLSLSQSWAFSDLVFSISGSCVSQGKKELYSRLLFTSRRIRGNAHTHQDRHTCPKTNVECVWLLNTCGRCKTCWCDVDDL